MQSIKYATASLLEVYLVRVFLNANCKSCQRKEELPVCSPSQLCLYLHCFIELGFSAPEQAATIWRGMMEEEITYATVVIKDGARSPNGKRVSHLTSSNVGAFSRYGKITKKTKHKFTCSGFLPDNFPQLHCRVITSVELKTTCFKVVKWHL